MGNIIPFFLLTAWCIVSQAAICNSNSLPTSPANRFVNNNDATVVDIRTGLIWRRCAEGFSLNNGGTITDINDDFCDSIGVNQLTWQQSFEQIKAINIDGFAGSNQWRLPNIKELASVVELQCFSNAINETIFPNHGVTFWSSTPVANSGDTWVIDFKSGDDSPMARSSMLGVWLVRDMY